MPRMFINEHQLDPAIIRKLNRAFWMALFGLLLAIGAIALWGVRWCAG